MLFQFQWEPSQIDRMTPSQISSALSDIVSFFRYVRENYASKLTELDGNISANKVWLDIYQTDRSRKPIIFLAGSVILLLLALVLRYITANSVGWNGLVIFLFNILEFPLFFISLFLLIPFIRTGVAKLRAPANIAKLSAELESMENSRQQTDDEMMTWARKNSDCFVKARTLLPDYYDNEYALLYMIQALNNHRATTLGEALNLYLNDRTAQQQASLLRQSIAAQNRAADAAQSAAAAAHSAAVSAGTAAQNTTYLRNK